MFYFIFIFSFLFLSSPVSRAQSLQTLFPKQAEIQVTQAGWQNLDLPSAIRNEVQSDYSNIRIYTQDGKEIPFWVGQGVKRKTIQSTGNKNLKILNAKRQEVKKGIFYETYELEIPSDLREDGNYQIHVQSSKDNFVKQVQIKSIDNESLLISTSVFRYGQFQEKLDLNFDWPGESKVLITFEGEGEYLEPSFVLLQENESNVQNTSDEALRQENLTILQKVDQNQKTIISLSRPLGLVPQSFSIQTSSENFSRNVQIFDLQKNQAYHLAGQGKIFNKNFSDQVENEEINISTLWGDKVQIEIENKDSPPLENLSVSAKVQKNNLFFYLKGNDFTFPATLSIYFGGNRVKASRYDLADLAQNSDFEKLVLLSREAKAGEAKTNPNYQEKLLVEGILKAGAKFDPRSFAFVQSIQVFGQEGIVSIPLELKHLEETKNNLGDFRILDKDFAQWPFQVSLQKHEANFDLSSQFLNTQNQKSFYAIRNPHPKIELESLQIQFEESFFDRSYRLYQNKGEVEERLIDSGRFRREPGSLSAFKVRVGGHVFSELQLIIEDGSERPLTLQKVNTSCDLPELSALLKEGKYNLYFGDKEVKMPQYEIQQFQNLIENLEVSKADLGPIQANPFQGQISKVSQEFGGNGEKHFYLWILLGLSVLVLAVFSLRLAKGNSTNT